MRLCARTGEGDHTTPRLARGTDKELIELRGLMAGTVSGWDTYKACLRLGLVSDSGLPMMGGIHGAGRDLVGPGVYSAPRR